MVCAGIGQEKTIVKGILASVSMVLGFHTQLKILVATNCVEELKGGVVKQPGGNLTHA